MSEKTVIEINGCKFEVDLRVARRIEEIRVGSRVKVLTKGYGDTFKVRHGIVIGFEPFKELPTVIIAAVETDYAGAKIEFIYYNAKTEGIEIVVALDDDTAALDKVDFLATCDREIAKKQLEIEEIENRKRYFLEKFRCYWEPGEQALKDALA